MWAQHKKEKKTKGKGEWAELIGLGMKIIIILLIVINNIIIIINNNNYNNNNNNSNNNRIINIKNII